jgi:hypothetical protein
MPLFGGMGAIGLYIVSCVAIGVAVFVADPSDIADALEIDVRKSMVQEFAGNTELKTAAIEAVSLTHQRGESYVGFAQISRQGKSERIQLVVKFDGRIMTWQLGATE